MDKIFTLLVFIFSAVVHEVAHGLVAEKFGDDTARDAGRITLNPIPHIDPFGSILLPGLLLLAGSPIVFGAAKPVPVNFNNLRPQRLGMALVSLAGPLSNLILAVLLILPVAFHLVTGTVAHFWTMAAGINVVLAVFNILPIPPLDGSKIVASLLPYDLMDRLLEFERYGFLLIVVFLMLGLIDRILLPVLIFFFRIFGVSI
jgi:Zn-dependent protease